MAAVSSPSSLRVNAHLNEESRLLSPKMEFSIVNFPPSMEFSGLNLNPSWMRPCASKVKLMFMYSNSLELFSFGLIALFISLNFLLSTFSMFFFFFGRLVASFWGWCASM